MEQTNDITSMLDMMLRPAFSVKDGKVEHVNQAAAALCVSTGTPIEELLAAGKQEYGAMTGGCLYLTVTLGEQVCGASVTKLEERDIFLVEHDEELNQLQAMALAARELREPLGNIMIAADQIRSCLEENTESNTQQQIARLNRGTLQMLRLISNMSDAARYSAEPKPRVELQNISALTDEVFEKAAALVEQAGMTLKYNSLREDVYTLMDAERIERAIYNLISNAVKFSPKGSTVQASVSRHGDFVHLRVQDCGCGIRDNSRGSVFTRYLRQPCIEDSLQGIGLGMVIVRSAATSHGGTVLMEQLPEKGTRFTVTFRINTDTGSNLRSPIYHIDYAGERDHALLELADTLPASAFESL